MAGLSEMVARAILDHIFSDPPYTPPTTFYLGLSSTVPAVDGSNFTEPSTGGYVRLATSASDWSGASGASPSVKANSTAFTWPVATDDWLAGAELVAFGLFDAPVAGSAVVLGELTVPKAVSAGDTPVCHPGKLQIKLGDPDDPYVPQSGELAAYTVM